MGKSPVAVKLPLTIETGALRDHTAASSLTVTLKGPFAVSPSKSLAVKLNVKFRLSSLPPAGWSSGLSSTKL